MDEDQRNARIFGVLFIITYLTSIPAVLLFQPVLDDPAGYIAGGGNDTQIYLGAFLDFLLILANVGTAVVLYPIARRQNELLAIGYVAACVIECVFLAGGIIFVLGVVSLRQDSPDAADLAVSIAQLKDWTFPLWPWPRRPLRERVDPRLRDVPLRSRPAAHDLARSDRRAAPSDRANRRALRLVRANQRGGAPGRPRVLVGSCRLASTRPSGDSGGTLRFFGAYTRTSCLREPASPPLARSGAVYASRL